MSKVSLLNHKIKNIKIVKEHVCLYPHILSESNENESKYVDSDQ